MTKIVGESLQKFLLLFAFAKSRIPLLTPSLRDFALSKIVAIYSFWIRGLLRLAKSKSRNDEVSRFTSQ